MKKFTVLSALLGIAIFIIVNVIFGRVMHDYYEAQNVLITIPNQGFNSYYYKKPVRDDLLVSCQLSNVG